MHDEQKYLSHLELVDEDCAENWEDYFLAFSKNMFPVAQKYGMTFGEAILMFKLNQVYNAIINQHEEDEYK